MDTIQITSPDVVEIEINITSPTVEVVASPIAIKGDTGLSAYDVAVKNGFVGSESDWLSSLKPDTIEWTSNNW